MTSMSREDVDLAIHSSHVQQPCHPSRPRATALGRDGQAIGTAGRPAACAEAGASANGVAAQRPLRIDETPPTSGVDGPGALTFSDAACCGPLRLAAVCRIRGPAFIAAAEPEPRPRRASGATA